MKSGSVSMCHYANTIALNARTTIGMTTLAGLMNGGITIPPPSPRLCQESAIDQGVKKKIDSNPIKENVLIGCARKNIIRYTHNLPTQPPTRLPVATLHNFSKINTGPWSAKNIGTMGSKPLPMTYIAVSWYSPDAMKVPKTAPTSPEIHLPGYPP